MANFRFIMSLLDYTPTASSEDSSFLATNLELYGHLFQPYKALVQNAIVNVTLDFGIGNTLSGLAPNPGIFLDDLNITSARIQGNSVTTDWVTPPWDQAITINQDPWNRRRKGFFRLADLSASVFVYRYLNVRILPQTGTDGGVYRIGRIAAGTITELSVNPGYDMRRSLIEPEHTNELEDGGFEVLELGSWYLVFECPRKLYTAATLTEELTIQTLSRGSNLVMWDAVLGGTEHAWMVRRIRNPEFKQGSTNIHESVWTFREVL